MTTSPTSPDAHTPGGDGVPEDVMAIARETMHQHFHTTVATTQRGWDGYVNLAARAIMADRASRRPADAGLIERRLRGADPDHVSPVDALRLHDQDPQTFPLSSEDVEGVLELIDAAADALAAGEGVQRPAAPAPADVRGLIERALREAKEWVHARGEEERGAERATRKLINQALDSISSLQPPAPAPLEQKETDNG